jgi:plasmid stabilization system protein ParE
VATVRWTSVAFRQFRGIVEYVAAFSPTAGSTLADRITQALDTLETFPRLGRMVLDYQDEAIRELIVGDYRVVYRLVGDEAGHGKPGGTGGGRPWHEPTESAGRA